MPLQLVFDMKLNYLPVKPGFLYKPKFSNSIEIFGPNEEEVEQTALEVEKRLSVPTFVRTQFKYNRVTCFLGKSVNISHWNGPSIYVKKRNVFT